MALGIASGVTPQAGIYAAIVGGFLVSMLSGSKFQISGPSGAFVVFVASIAERYGSSGLQMITLMAGAILLFMGITNLGNSIKFLPRCIIVGLANGIAVLIGAKAINDVLGLHVSTAPGKFLPLLSDFVKHLNSLGMWTGVLAIASLAVIILTPAFIPKLPGSIVALTLGTAAARFFHLPVQTIGTRFGNIPSGLPSLVLPVFQLNLIAPLLIPAFALAILISMESLLSAVVADTLSGARHNSRAELLGQGIANLCVPMVGGLPVAGAVVPTAANFR